MSGVERGMFGKLADVLRKRVEDLRYPSKWQYLPRGLVNVDGKEEVVGPYYFRSFGPIIGGLVVEVHPDGHAETNEFLTSKKIKEYARTETMRALPTLVKRLNTPDN